MSVKDWHLACVYFKQTLSSIFNSANGNYCVVVAGHEGSGFPVAFGFKIQILRLDHSLPSQENGYYLAAVKGKLINLKAAWKYAKSTWSPQYVMKLDGDDLVSSRLVEWIENTSCEAGYFIKHGWFGARDRAMLFNARSTSSVSGVRALSFGATWAIGQDPF